nr:MAG TPA: hypothetical protein [Caudoviricetes sp.]
MPSVHDVIHLSIEFVETLFISLRFVGNFPQVLVAPFCELILDISGLLGYIELVCCVRAYWVFIPF